jgi:hypothetical protein
MVNQKVAEIASQAAASHMTEVIKSAQNINSEETSTVYAVTFVTLMVSCNIPVPEFHKRVRDYVDKVYEDLDEQSRRGVVGNIIKESTNPNMGQKVFKKLIRAVFPAE